jgi:hypothetical protein
MRVTGWISQQPYDVQWGGGMVWGNDHTNGTEATLTLLESSVGRSFDPGPGMPDLVLSLDDPRSVLGCLNGSTTLGTVEDGPLLAPPLPEGAIG